MRIAQEEIFGPVVVRDSASATTTTRSASPTTSMYGLGAAVWSRDQERALRLAREIEAGTVWINDYHLLNVRFPFGGYKQSGVRPRARPVGPRRVPAAQAHPRRRADGRVGEVLLRDAARRLTYRGTRD